MLDGEFTIWSPDDKTWAVHYMDRHGDGGVLVATDLATRGEAQAAVRKFMEGK